MTLTITTENVLQVMKKNDCCRTCKFFVDDGMLYQVQNLTSNAIAAVETSGECRRFPPTHIEGRGWRYPIIDVRITKYSEHLKPKEDDRTFCLVDDAVGEWPWCGESVRKSISVCLEGEPQ